MPVKTIIKKSTYFDSVSLMVLSTKANGIANVRQAVIAMGTELNKDVLKNVGLYTEDVQAATPGDLMMVVDTENEHIDTVIGEIEALMSRRESSDLSHETKYSTIENAVKNTKGANIAIISVPGMYAYNEAKKALENGLNVMIFSDNVSVEHELILKKMAHEKGLLVMGPDCGTAIISGKGLCFANNVRSGNIGIVAASGTGSQEVSVRIHDFGGGVSHLIGTGGRDLSADIGGISMIDGLDALLSDNATDVIVLVSKPPAKEVADKIYAKVKTSHKPIVVCFLGGDEKEVVVNGGVYAKTTKEAALKAVVLAGKNESEINTHPLNMPLISEVKEKLNRDQKYIRGLFCGGTICDEVMGLVNEKYNDVYSNIAKKESQKLKDINKSEGHTFIDFGDDAFTNGRPHPMIDPSIRIDRFKKEAMDKEVGVILLDFVLGYGAHPDPVSDMLPAITEAKKNAEKEGRHLEVLGFVLGTENDPQNFDAQVEKLMSYGVTIASSVVNTGLLSRGFVDKEAN